MIVQDAAHSGRLCFRCDVRAAPSRWPQRPEFDCPSEISRPRIPGSQLHKKSVSFSYEKLPRFRRFCAKAALFLVSFTCADLGACGRSTELLDSSHAIRGRMRLFAVATGSLFDAASLEVNHMRDHCPTRVEGKVLESPSPIECAHLTSIGCVITPKLPISREALSAVRSAN